MKRLLASFRRPPEPASEPAPEPEIIEPEPEVPAEPEAWTSSVAFGADGWYYPVLDDDNGEEIGPDFTRPLIHNTETGAWDFAQPEHRSHQEFWTTKHPQGSEQVLEVEL